MDSEPPPSGPRTYSGSVGQFLGLTFAGTWLLQVPAVLAQRGAIPGDPAGYLPLAMLGVFAPLAAATFLTARSSGRAAVLDLYRGLLPVRTSWRWYAAALFVPGALLAAVLWLLGLAGREGEFFYTRGSAALSVGLVIAVAEEVGFRGYALPRLQQKVGPLAAGGLLGVVWTVWHVPMFLGLGIPLSLLLVMLLYFVGGSLTITWLYNRSGKGLLLAVLAHFGAHLNNSHAALPGDQLPLVVHAVVYGAIGFAAVMLDRAAFPRRTPSTRRGLEWRSASLL